MLEYDCVRECVLPEPVGGAACGGSGGELADGKPYNGEGEIIGGGGCGRGGGGCVG